MKIVLTGATSPIGKVVLKHLSNHTVNVVGHDLTKIEDQNRLIELTKHSDVFINLAHIGYVQGILLELSEAKTNISFTSLITQYPWAITKTVNTAEYVAQKLFLEHVHISKPNSVLISISNYGDGPIPSVSDTQITEAIDSVLLQEVKLPTRIDVNNGLGDLHLKYGEMRL